MAVHFQDVFYLVRGAIGRGEETAVALFLEAQHQFHVVFAGVPPDIGQDIPGVRLGIGHDGEDIGHGMGFYLFPAHGRIGAADTGKEDAQVVVDFGGGGYGTAGVLDVHLLLDGDGRRNALDDVYVGLGHATQELPGIGGKAFGKTALPFGEKGVEGQGTLAAAAHAGNHHQAVTGNLHRNLLEVVHTGLSDNDISLLRHRLQR